MKDYYGLLGIKRDASRAEIKRAYQRQMLRLHPDLENRMTDGQLKEITEAYQTLIDFDRRYEYDYTTRFDLGCLIRSAFGSVPPG